jgi:hypothetical protein
MKPPRPPVPTPGTPEAEACHTLARLAAVWIISTLVLLIIATFKA